MRLAIDVALDYDIPEPADILLHVEVAAMEDQRLIEQELMVGSPQALVAVAGGDSLGQRCWVKGEGAFTARYHGVVDIDRAAIDLTPLRASEKAQLSELVIPYLMPSRYCEADRFEQFVRGEFAGLEGGALAGAIADWVHDKLDYVPGASDGRTTAMNTFVDRQGVCRDYAHLFAALARAGGLPTRCVSAYAPRVDPPDFHAVNDVWLEDGWHLIDATRMSGCDDVARIAVGRDATDIAFMTVFGQATLKTQKVAVMKQES